MKQQRYIDSLSKLSAYCSSSEYKGYSLFDSHNSFIPFAKFGHTISFLSNQMIKRSPINIRRFIGVQKQYNPKGMGLFLMAYVLQKQYGNPLQISDLDEKIKMFYDWLRNNPSKGYSGHCWGYNYSWPKSDGIVVPAYTPSSVVTGFNIRAMFKYYLMTNDNTFSDIVKGAENFIYNDIPKTENDDGICFSYTPVKRDMTINANLLAAEILAYSDYALKTDKNHDTIKKIIDFTMHHQNSDGSWYYSFDTKSGKPKKQIDFHQGYVLESIKNICDYSKIDIEDYRTNIELGLKFYRKNQFDNKGFAYWRIPKKWPIDIHNQSQGIITFSIFSDYSSEYFEFANKIADWTLSNMQNNGGNFYYQKWPFITNKVPYMRWNQGWMMVALSTLIGNYSSR